MLSVCAELHNNDMENGLEAIRVATKQIGKYPKYPLLALERFCCYTFKWHLISH